MKVLIGQFYHRNRPWHPEYKKDGTKHHCPICKDPNSTEGTSHMCLSCKNETLSGMTTTGSDKITSILAKEISRGRKGGNLIRVDAGDQYTNHMKGRWTIHKSLINRFNKSKQNKIPDIAIYKNVKHNEVNFPIRKRHNITLIEVNRTDEQNIVASREIKKSKYEPIMGIMRENGHQVKLLTFTSGVRIPILHSQWKMLSELGIPKDRLPIIHSKMWVSMVRHLHKTVVAYRKLENEAKREENRLIPAKRSFPNTHQRTKDQQKEANNKKQKVNNHLSGSNQEDTTCSLVCTTGTQHIPHTEITKKSILGGRKAIPANNQEKPFKRNRASTQEPNKRKTGITWELEPINNDEKKFKVLKHKELGKRKTHHESRGPSENHREKRKLL